jgi:hypothetical protein
MTQETKSSDLSVAHGSGLSTLPAVIGVGDLFALSTEIVKSKLSPLKTAEDVFIVLKHGQELGLTPMVALSNIHVIGSRPAIGIHIITAKLLSNSIIYKIIQDYEPYKIKGADGQEVFKTFKYNGKDIPDYRTKIVFKRQLRQFDGTIETMEIDFTLRLSEINQLGLLERDQWQKQPRTMLRTRCLSMGARLIASDLLNGFYEISEAADIAKKDVNVTEDGQVLDVETLS